MSREVCGVLCFKMGGAGMWLNVHELLIALIVDVMRSLIMYL